MSSALAGYNAARSTWQAAQLPTKESGWDTYDSRLLRYWFNQVYHDNTVYDAINAYSTQMKVDKKLYQFTRGIYNPVARQNGIYVSKVYPGALDLDTLTTGAIPIQADQTVRDAIKQLWIWSNWGSQKNLYVRQGAKFADSFIKVLDDRDHRKVRFEIIDPRYIKYKRTDSVGNLIEVHIEYEMTDHDAIVKPVTGSVRNEDKTFTYTEIITKEKISVFRDGEPWKNYHEFAPNGEWENIYGFVQMVQAQHMDIGLDYGSTSYRDFTSKIDEINDAASMLNDQIRKVINPIWYYAGVAGPEEIDITQAQKDSIPAIYGPIDSQPYPMIAQIDIEHAGNNIVAMLSELEADMPELALHRMRQQLGSISGIAVTSLYDDAASRITEAQSNYDAPLIKAMQMAITIGAMGRYDGFTAFNERSYDNGDIEIMIRERPPLRDTLTKTERMNLLLQTGAPAPAIWEELGYGDKVKEWTQYAKDDPAQQEAEVAEQIEAMN